MHFWDFFLDFWDRSDPKVPVPITKLWYPKRNWVEIFFARTGGLQLPLAAGVLFLYLGTEFCTAGTDAWFWGIFFSKFLYVLQVTTTSLLLNYVCAKFSMRAWMLTTTIDLNVLLQHLLRIRCTTWCHFFGILAILPVDTKFRSTTVVNLVHSSTDFL